MTGWAFALTLTPNGTAGVVGFVTRRSTGHGPDSYRDVPLGPGTVPVHARYGAVFASHGSEVIEQDVCRGTRLIGN